MESYFPADGDVRAFREASKEFDAVYARFAKACGLSDAEFWSMLMIRNGVTTQSEISGQLFLSRQTINSAFKLLVKKGLVRLETAENNQRIKYAVLTQRGELFAARYIDRMMQIEQQAWQELEQEEQDTLTRLTRKYCELIQTALQQGITTEQWSSEDTSSE